MTTWTTAIRHPGLAGEYQARRLEAFKAAHPDVPVLLAGETPTAWVGQTPIAGRTLLDLLDAVERYMDG